MDASLTQLIIFMLLGILVIIILTARFHVHAFFALMIACFITGIGIGMPVPTLIETIKTGFGNIMKSLGFIIVLGTTLGVILEHTGCTRVMAAYILKKTGEKRASLALSLTGFIVGMPVFCDSGYIVLSGLNKSLSQKTKTPIIITSVSLATGLYAIHCLIPPHPGAAAAASTLQVDFGKLILYGTIIALPAMLVGHYWSLYAGKKTGIAHHHEEELNDQGNGQNPHVLLAFLPIIVPILLIAAKSFFSVDSIHDGGLVAFLTITGDPVIALSIGIILAFAAGRNWTKHTSGLLLRESAEKAGGILVIIGAGGAFGAVLAATNMASHFSDASALNSLGILFPFLLTSLLKTAQGSSTVAIITASSVVLPFIPSLGLDSDNGRLLCVLAMGAGSMTVSHANDAYFWVITKFSGLDIKNTLKVYSTATALMGIVTMLMIYMLSFFLQH